MSASHSPLTPYDDPASTDELWADCRETESRLALTRAARQALRPAPSIRFEDHPQGMPKQDIDLLRAAQRLAHAMGLDLD